VKAIARRVAPWILGLLIGTFLVVVPPLAASIQWTTYRLGLLLIAVVGIGGGVLVAKAWIAAGKVIDAAPGRFADVEVSINARCCAKGHNYRPSIVDGERVWTCSECGDYVVCELGWIGDAS
jgi:hypothetical protein